MSQLANTNFVVVKFLGLPEVFSQFYYKCIHRSWIVARDGKNVFVASSLHTEMLLPTHSLNISEVYPAALEYETDDVDDGMRFVQEKLAEHLQKRSPAECEEDKSALQFILKVLPSK